MENKSETEFDLKNFYESLVKDPENKLIKTPALRFISSIFNNLEQKVVKSLMSLDKRIGDNNLLSSIFGYEKEKYEFGVPFSYFQSPLVKKTVEGCVAGAELSEKYRKELRKDLDISGRERDLDRKLLKLKKEKEAASFIHSI